MKANRFQNEGDFWGFEIPNTLIGKKGVKEILLRLSDLEIKYLDKGWSQELFCEFSYKGLKFEVSEPYGDSGYYDFNCEKPNTEALEEIYDLFVSTTVPTRNQIFRLAVLITIILAIIFTWYRNS